MTKMDGLPLYIQVRNSLREGIERGTIRPDASGVLPSQQEFAEHFNVGLATVKRAIKDLEEMGLVMSRRGKGLTLSPALRRDVDEATGAKRMPSVGVALFDITGRMSSPYFRRIMSGVEAFSNERHIALHVVSLPGVEMDLQEETFLNSISLVNLDGLLILSPVSSGFVSRLAKREIPYVAVNVLADRGEVCHVIDFVATAAVVLDPVFDRGYKHPMIFIGNETKLSSCLKYFGYKQALIRHGIKPDPAHIAYEDYDIDSAIRAVERRLASGVELDAVVAYDDMMAVGIQDYLVSKGREDVLVVGSGNYNGYEDKVKITTDERLRELGYNSLATLFGMMNGIKPEKTKFTYDPILIERDKM